MQQLGMTVRVQGRGVERRAPIEMSDFVRADLSSGPWHVEYDDDVEYDDIIA